jgi:hypothetical protein
MKFPEMIITILLFFSLSCVRSEKEFSVQDSKKVSKLEEIGTYTKMVQLETHEDALLGSINKIVIDSRNGDILASDTSVNQAVFRFDRNGKYILRYGKKGEGPGEYQRLLTFTQMADGKVAIFAIGKRLIFEANGAFLREEFTSTNDCYAESIGNKLYIYSLIGSSYSNKMVSILDAELNERARFHPLDHRLKKKIFFPNKALAVVNGKLAVSELYDFKISLYDPYGQFEDEIQLPNQNHELNSYWKKSAKELKDKKMSQTLFQTLRRARAIHGVGNVLHILESHPESKLIRSNIWNLETNKIHCYDGVRLVNAGRDADYLSMSQLVGSDDNGLIGVCDDPELFSRFKHRYPAATGIEFTDADNPVILFFELNIPNDSPSNF